MGLKFAILYEGETKQGQKMVKSMMEWPSDRILNTLKKHFSMHNNLDSAFAETIKEFKRLSTKIP